MAKRKSKEQVAEDRSKRQQAQVKEEYEASAPVREARQVRNDYVREQAKQRSLAALDQSVNEADPEFKKSQKPHLLESAKPGSGAGLKPGDWFAPKSNPGAAARVPSQPLQPETLQSHGKGIIFDKDLDNPPYDAGDPVETDEAPSGTGSRTNARSQDRGVDKEAEREKAEKATPRSKMTDPDVRARGRRGKDATASPEPIGSHAHSRTDVPGGSNSGVDEDVR